MIVLRRLRVIVGPAVNRGRLRRRRLLLLLLLLLFPPLLLLLLLLLPMPQFPL